MTSSKNEFKISCSRNQTKRLSFIYVKSNLSDLKPDQYRENLPFFTWKDQKTSRRG